MSLPANSSIEPDTHDAALPIPLRRLLLLSLGLWSIPVILTSAAIMAVASQDLETSVRLAIRIWFAWAIFLPLTLWLSFRFPLVRPKLSRRMFILLLGWLVVAVGNQAVTRFQAKRLGMAPVPIVVVPRESEDSPKRWLPERYRGAPPQARIVLDSMLYVTLSLACHAFLWARLARDRQQRALIAEAQLAQSHLTALQLQLNPHFMFNALNGLTALIHEAPADAEVLLGHLSELLRSALALSEHHEIPLERELQLLDHYLAVEQTRYGSRLHCQQNIDTDCLTGTVPTFLLQPLVENAIKHGVDPHREGGRVKITIKRRADRLAIEIEDTGEGLKQPGSQGAGVGLQNTRSRLQQLYPNDHRFTLTTPDSRGCLVTLDLPFRVADKSNTETE